MSHLSCLINSKLRQVLITMAVLQYSVLIPAMCIAFDDIDQKKEFYFGGFESERGKLISGIVHGIGESTYTYDDGEVFRGKNETLFIAFDHSKGLMRVDREIPQRMQRSESRELNDRFHSHFVRIPEYDIRVTYRADDELSSVWITNPAVPSLGLEQNVPAYPFDIRIISQIRSQPRWWKPFPFDQYEKTMPSRFSEYECEGNGIHRFSVDSIAPPGEMRMSSRRSFWVDEECGYAVIKARQEYIPLETTDEPWKIRNQSQTTWDEIDGVWVPVSHAFDEKVNVNPGKPCLSVKMSFDWESVNEPVPEGYFIFCDFGLDPLSPIQDVRKANGDASKAVLIGHIGELVNSGDTMPTYLLDRSGTVD
jgi:hypothetical protein